MKFAVIRKKRAVSAFLSVCMTATMLPLAPIASAIDETAQPPDVRIGWAAAGAVENGVGTIRLTAELGQESVVQSAEVRIRLTAEEAMLLDWESGSLAAFGITLEKPGTEPNGAHTPAPDENGEPAPDGGGEPAPDSAPSAGDNSLPLLERLSLPFSALFTRSDSANDDCFLVFTLNAENRPIDLSLTFRAPEGGTVAVTEDDITVTVQPETATPRLSVTTEMLEIPPAQPAAAWDYALTAVGGAPCIVWREGSTEKTLSDFSFLFTVTEPAAEEAAPALLSEGETQPSTASFQLSLPDGISPPEQALTVAAPDGTHPAWRILSGETVVAELSFTTEGTASVQSAQSNGGSRSLTFTLSYLPPASEMLEEPEYGSGEPESDEEVAPLPGAGPSSDVENQPDSAGPAMPAVRAAQPVNVYTCAIDFRGAAFTVNTNETSDSTAVSLAVTGLTENSTAITIPEGLIPISLPLSDTTAPGQRAVHKSEQVTQDIYWRDNNDESNKRPDAGEYGFGAGQYRPTLHYTLTPCDADGNPLADSATSEPTELTAESLKELGLSEWPDITPTSSGISIGLPQIVSEDLGYGAYRYYLVEWTLAPPEWDGYSLVEVQSGDDAYPSVNNQPGWYYMLRDEFTVRVNLRWGDQGAPDEEVQTPALLDQFQFRIEYGNAEQVYPIKDLFAQSNASYTPEADDEGSYTQVTIGNLWKYNIDGTPMTYQLEEIGAGDSADGKLNSGELGGAFELDDGDCFQISYDNTGVPNHASETGAVYSGGRINLTLSGTTTYQATKCWLDSETNGKLETRPDAEFQLWRYRLDESAEKYGSNKASPVRYESGERKGEIVTLVIRDDTEPTAESCGNGTHYMILFTDDSGDPLNLPKYDQDGYEYVYAVREYLDAGQGDGSYEQKFGEIQNGDTFDDTLPDGIPNRAPTDEFVYDNGTLSNRLTGTTSASVTKVWKSAAYQADFEKVAVELTLQRKTPSTGWEAATDSAGKPITHVMHSFFAERLSDTYTQNGLPTYDALGEKYQYRWVETAVYQGEAIAELDEGATKEEIQAALKQAERHEVTQSGDIASFDLVQKQSGSATYEEVHYISETATDGNGTTITNRPEETIGYTVVKRWEGGVAPRQINIYLYQTTTGALDNEAYVHFQMDQKYGIYSLQLPNGITITKQGDWTDTEWTALVAGLPKFDENGHAYEYILLEAGADGEQSFPTYETKRLPNGDYQTTVINGRGPGSRVMVRKIWQDDGDILHREPVTLQAYYKEAGSGHLANTPVEGASITLKDNVWHGYIGLPAGVKADEVYIVETAVGDSKVEHGTTISYKQLYQTGAPAAGSSIFEVTTDNHRYQVTYEEGSINPAGQGTGEPVFVVTNRRLGSIDLTVSKKWVDGDSEDIMNAISKELQAIYQGGRGSRLALAFRLVFADADAAAANGWKITYDGTLSDGNTVSVGGETVPIYSKYDETSGTYSNPASSEQAIIGINEKGEVEINTSWNFYGLPKYASGSGGIVAYDVEELWLNMTDTSPDGTPTVVTDLSRYSETLAALWADYHLSTTLTYHANVAGQHTRDTQTLDATNYRSDTKSVTWTKVWMDDFSYTNGQRPDIYLDIYSVSHVPDGSGGYQERISVVQKNYRWTASSASSIDALADSTIWTVTLPDMPMYDQYGFEIKYYAVERTQVQAGDYDYQAVQYSYDKNGDGSITPETEYLGNRDAPNDNATAEYVLDLKDTGKWEGGQLPAGLAGIGPFAEGGTPRYALRNGGTFTNTLSANYVIAGKKLWENMPSGWLTATDTELPEVTFNVYRYLSGQVPPDGTPDEKNRVASLTIPPDAWPLLKNGSYYPFQIDHLGDTTLQVTDNGVQYVYEPGADTLPRYDEQGRLYTYRVVERIDWSDTDAGNATGEVFTSKQDANFTFTNTYQPDTGALRVKKLLSLPADTGADTGGFPSVTFRLTRAYQGSSQESVTDTRFSVSSTISSSQVQQAFNAAKEEEPNADPVVFALCADFKDLPLYAPNGSRYTYTVKEDELKGYTTYAQAGDVSDTSAFGDEHKTDHVSSLWPEQLTDTGTEPLAKATFYNVWQENPSGQSDQVTLTGVKAWADYDDLMHTRPDMPTDLIGGSPDDPLGLTVSRQVSGESGWHELIRGTDYTIQYEKGNDNQWRFTIQGANNSGELKRYATSGKAWRYRVTEKVENGMLQQTQYSPTNGTGSWRTSDSADGSGVIDLGSVTNSIYANARFQKQWTDADDQPITEDYLGFDLTVKFKLQVSANGGAWQDADTYFSASGGLGLDASAIQKIRETVRLSNAQGVAGEPFSAQITGRIDDSLWKNGGAFTGLPRTLTISGQSVSFTYRVVETEVSYGGTVQQIGAVGQDNHYTGIGEGLVTGALLNVSGTAVTTSTTTNRLSSTSLTLKKVWEDESNRYNSRPNPSGEAMDWEAWFLVQRTTDSEYWEIVDLIRLYGHNTEQDGDHWSETLSGLPTADFTGGGSPYTYRVCELQPNTDGYTLDMLKGMDETALSGIMVKDGGTFQSGNNDYTTSYRQEQKVWTVTNTLKTKVPERGKLTVRAEKVWRPETPDDASVTLVLQRSVDGGGWTDLQTAVLNAESSWLVVWDNLPAYDGGSLVSYQVTERNATPDYVALEIQKDEQTVGDTQTISYTFTNVEPMSFTVTKKWNPTDSAPEAAEVSAGLYRTTDAAQINSTDPANRVPVQENTPDGAYRTVTLNADNQWAQTFTGLPKCDKGGTTYHYYALELDGDGKPIAPHGGGVYGGGRFHVDYDNLDPAKTVITNTPSIRISGTKTWKDNGNAYGTRPDSLTLTLQRTTASAPADGDWETVLVGGQPLAPVWSGTDTDQWTYAYADLPKYDADGNLYTYRVTETVPEGYKEANNGNGDNNRSFTNTLSGTVSIQGRKVWEGGAASEAPALTLERRAASTQEEWEAVPDANPVWNPDRTAFTYTGLPKFDSRIRLYEYRVREAVPEGYDVYYAAGSAADETQHTGKPASVDGLQITNIRRGGLTVAKEVTGSRGDHMQAFDFSATFTLPDGFSEHNTAPTVSWSKTDGTTGTASFDSSGKAAVSFTLKADESITFTNLPGNTGYAVTETNAYGHSQSSQNAINAIAPGETEQARFTNHRSGGGTTTTTVTVSGQKRWSGDTEDERPGSVIVILYADGEEIGRQTVTAADSWRYRFPDLPKYDNGREIQYTVREQVPEGYTPTYSGYDITNTRTDASLAALRVTKAVTGTEGETSRDFHFVVTLGSASVNGDYGGMTFAGGIARFTLRDGQSITASGLPVGVSYQVSETEAGSDGYTTTCTGETGTLASGATATASFVNQKGETLPEEPVEPDEPTDPNDPDSSEDPHGPDRPGGSGEPGQTDTDGGSDRPVAPSEGGAVRTADNFNLPLYASMLLLFTLGLAATLYLGRPRRGGKHVKRR